MPGQPHECGVRDDTGRRHDDTGRRHGTSRRHLLAGLGAVAAGALAGCAGGPGAGPGSGGPDDGSSTPLSTDARQRFPDFEWSLLDDAEPVATDAIVMRDFAFHPPVAQVPPGTEVTVRNEDSAGHEITVPRLGVDETLDGGESVSFTAEQAGTYDYVCEFHPPDMLGRLVVEPEG